MSGPKARTVGGVGKTVLSIEWTNQHGCGDGDLNCNIILQYICQPKSVKDTYGTLRNGKNLIRTFPLKRPNLLSFVLCSQCFCILLSFVLFLQLSYVQDTNL